MKANELRIGNWVEYFGKNKQIDGIKSMSISKGYAVEIISTDIHGNSTSEYSPLESLSLQPIPLTEEWLLRFGFEKIKDGVYEMDNKDKDTDFIIYLNEQDSKLTALKIWQADPVYISGVSEFVHQLQNLYFALTGEELKLKS